MTTTRIVVVGLDYTVPSIADAVSILNGADQDLLEFEAVSSERSLPNPDLGNAHLWASVHPVVKAAGADVDALALVGVVPELIEGNWFTHVDQEDRTVVISTAGLERISNLPVGVYIAYAVVEVVTSLMAPVWKNHEQTGGCLGDFYQKKDDILEGIKSGGICDGCADVLRRELGDDAFAAIRRLLVAVSKAAVQA